MQTGQSSTFFESLREVLEQVPPLQGEETFHDQLKLTLEHVFNDDEKRALLGQLGEQFERELVMPHFDFRNVGSQLPHGWTTVKNAAEFGTDYISRMAVAKSNIFVNRPREAKYFYLEVDKYGARLNGSRQYEIVLNHDQLPQNRGFWSLTVYDENHQLVELDRRCSSFAVSASRHHVNELFATSDRALPRQDRGESNIVDTSSQRQLHRVPAYLCTGENVLHGQWSPPGVSPIPNAFIAAN